MHTGGDVHGHIFCLAAHIISRGGWWVLECQQRSRPAIYVEGKSLQTSILHSWLCIYCKIRQAARNDPLDISNSTSGIIQVHPGSSLDAKKLLNQVGLCSNQQLQADWHTTIGCNMALDMADDLPLPTNMERMLHLYQSGEILLIWLWESFHTAETPMRILK